MNIKERMIEIIKWSKLSTVELEKLTEINRYTWGNIKNRGQRVNEDHIEAIAKIWPQFRYWIISGKTLPEAGQISPEISDYKENERNKKKIG